MGNICNPVSMRLGHHSFWVSQTNFTLGNHNNIVSRYNNQNYIYTLQYFMQWFFSEQYRSDFYMRLFIIFKTIQINFIGYYPRYTYAHLQLIFYDFKLHVTKNLNIDWKTLRYAIKYRMKETIHNVRYKKKHLLEFNNYKLLTKFISKYLETFHIIKRTTRLYFWRFISLLKKLHFFRCINRIHKYYYPNLKYKLYCRLVPVSETLDANYVATYIERRIRTGGHVQKVLSQVAGFLRRSRFVIGYKLCCSGRFRRGARKGYVWRVKGQYSYGSFSNKLQMQYASTSTILRAGICGIKVWMVIQSLKYRKKIKRIRKKGKKLKKL